MSDLDKARTLVRDAIHRDNPTQPARWRLIATDSESLDGVALVCPQQRGPLHHIPDTDQYAEAGVYDCCPWPQFEVFDRDLAAYLVALLNADAEHAARPVPLCDCGAEIPVPQRKAYCSDRCRWADQDHGSDDVDGGDES